MIQAEATAFDVNKRLKCEMDFVAVSEITMSAKLNFPVRALPVVSVPHNSVPSWLFLPVYHILATSKAQHIYWNFLQAIIGVDESQMQPSLWLVTLRWA